LEFCRTYDLELVRKILTSPDIYEHMGDDFIGPREEFEPNPHEAIWYVVAARWSAIAGLFTLIPENRVCWKLHACMLPDATTTDKWEAARGLAPWLEERTQCRRLVAEVPRSNKPAIVYGVHGIGMRYVGTHPKAFQKYGRLQDLIILGREIGGERREFAGAGADDREVTMCLR
jgi:hypothetical protein